MIKLILGFLIDFGVNFIIYYVIFALISLIIVKIKKTENKLLVKKTTWIAIAVALIIAFYNLSHYLAK